MLINVTLFVQMVHFALAYYIIKIFLLRPAVSIILKKDKEERALQNAIYNQQKKLSEQEEAQRAQQAQLKELLRTQVPQVDKVIPFSMPDIPIMKIMVAQNQVSTMVQEVKNALVRRISRG